jgi:N-acetylneuraminic acid mutarotase
MSPATESLVKKLVVVATLAGLGSALAFLLVACGGRAHAAAKPRPAAWQALPPAPLKGARLAGLESVWTGKELIVSGVRAGPDGTFVKSTDVAAAYDPATRAWRRLARPQRMDGACGRAAVWTGREMVVWGCFGKAAAFDPAGNRWRRLPQAPTGEGIAVWTGRELIGWGGGCCGDAWSGGSAYDPATNSWRTLAPSPLAPEQRPVGAWTGRKLILLVSGIQAVDGKPAPARLARAASYDPATDTWRRIAPPPGPALRFGGTAVWDGRDVVVVGAGAHARTMLAYRPETNRWRRLSSSPSGLPGAEAFWTGKRLLVWGGGAESPRGLAYDPSTDRWSSLPPAPLQGSGQTVAWTGRELIAWSRIDGAAFTP